MSRCSTALALLLLACEGPTVGLERQPEAEASELPPPPPAPPGAGAAFVVSNLSTRVEARVDDGVGRAFALHDDRVRQDMLGGDLLYLIEVAGLDADYDGEDPTVEVRIYDALDSDDPIFPANNFGVPPGDTECCAFSILEDSLTDDEPRRARWRLSGSVDDEILETVSPGPLELRWLPDRTALRQRLRLEAVRVRLGLPVDSSDVRSGVLSGVVTVGTLDAIADPRCRFVNPRCPNFDGTMLDLTVATAGAQPDVDLDGDGLECLRDLDGDGLVDQCCDGGPDACGACTVVPPVDPAVPSSCVHQEAMADGFAITFDFTAVPATIGAPR